MKTALQPTKIKVWFKGIVHPKMKIQSTFTRPSVAHRRVFYKSTTFSYYFEWKQK